MKRKRQVPKNENILANLISLIVHLLDFLKKFIPCFSSYKNKIIRKNSSVFTWKY